MLGCWKFTRTNEHNFSLKKNKKKSETWSKNMWSNIGRYNTMVMIMMR